MTRVLIVEDKNEHEEYKIPAYAIGPLGPCVRELADDIAGCITTAATSRAWDVIIAPFIFDWKQRDHAISVCRKHNVKIITICRDHHELRMTDDSSASALHFVDVLTALASNTGDLLWLHQHHPTNASR